MEDCLSFCLLLVVHGWLGLSSCEQYSIVLCRLMEFLTDRFERTAFRVLVSWKLMFGAMD